MGMTKQATKFTCDAKIATVGLLGSSVSLPPCLLLLPLLAVLAHSLLESLIFELLKRITLSRSMGALVLILARAFATELELAFSAWFCSCNSRTTCSRRSFSLPPTHLTLNVRGLPGGSTSLGQRCPSLRYCWVCWVGSIAQQVLGSALVRRALKRPATNAVVPHAHGQSGQLPLRQQAAGGEPKPQQVRHWPKAASTVVQSIFDRACRHSPANGCPEDESAAPLAPRFAVARRSPPNAPRCPTHCPTPDRRSSAQRAPPRGYASSSEHALKGLASAHAPSMGRGAALLPLPPHWRCAQRATRSSLILRSASSLYLYM